jgi:formylglycine-generating enzyme required for sulfatase activity
MATFKVSLVLQSLAVVAIWSQLEYLGSGQESLAIATPANSEVVSESITNSVGMKLVPISAGRFTMGSPASERGSQEDELLHKVELTQSFHMGATEVTEHQWAMVMEEPFRTEIVEIRDPETKRLIKREEKQIKNPKLDSQLPITNISWLQASEFCNRLGQLPEEKKERRSYRLPTEAEWEYACRAGSSTAFFFGDEPDSLAEYAWCALNTTGGKPSVVARKLVNAFGLYDMHGNVAEWCSDYYGAYSEELQTDPTGVEKAASIQRVARGGSFQSRDSQCRSASRGRVSELGQPTIGLRVVLSPPDTRASAREGFKVTGRVTEIPLQIPRDDASEPPRVTQLSISPSGRFYWALLDTKLPSTYVLGDTADKNSQRVYPIAKGISYESFQEPVWNEQESLLAIPVGSREKGYHYLLLNPIDGAVRELIPPVPLGLERYIRRMKFSPNGKEVVYMFSQSRDEEGNKLDATTLVTGDLDGRQLSELKVWNQSANGMDFVFLNDNFVVVKSNSLSLWNLQTRKKVTELLSETRVEDRLMFAGDAKLVFINSQSERSVLRWDVTDPSVPKPLEPIKGLGSLVSIGKSAEYFCSGYRNDGWIYNFFDKSLRLYDTLHIDSNLVSFSQKGTVLTGVTSLDLISPIESPILKPLFMSELQKDHRLHSYSTSSSTQLVFKGDKQIAALDLEKQNWNWKTLEFSGEFGGEGVDYSTGKYLRVDNGKTIREMTLIDPFVQDNLDPFDLFNTAPKPKAFLHIDLAKMSKFWKQPYPKEIYPSISPDGTAILLWPTKGHPAILADRNVDPVQSVDLAKHKFVRFADKQVFAANVNYRSFELLSIYFDGSTSPSKYSAKQDSFDPNYFSIGFGGACFLQTDKNQSGTSRKKLLRVADPLTPTPMVFPDDYSIWFDKFVTCTSSPRVAGVLGDVILVWDSHSTREIVRLQLPEGIDLTMAHPYHQFIGFSRDGRYLCAAVNKGNAIAVWKLP